jgi:hypothetical protein
LVINNDGVNFKMNHGGDVEYLGRKVTDLEKKCAVVDRLLMGTSTPFTRRVADYLLHEKFKVP